MVRQPTSLSFCMKEIVNECPSECVSVCVRVRKNERERESDKLQVGAQENVCVLCLREIGRAPLRNVSVTKKEECV